MKKRTFTQRDYIKANRRASRLAEIENHTRPVNIAGVHKSKKVYDRKGGKAEMKKALPYLFLYGLCEWLPNRLHFINTLSFRTLSGLFTTLKHNLYPIRCIARTKTRLYTRKVII